MDVNGCRRIEHPGAETEENWSLMTGGPATLSACARCVRESVWCGAFYDGKSGQRWEGEDTVAYSFVVAIRCLMLMPQSDIGCINNDT